MAFNEILAERVRDLLADQPDLTEQKMFGGIAFLLGGNMAVGVSGDSLMVRVGAEDYDAALDEPGVDVFGKTGSPMRGWVLASPEIIASDADLAAWIDRGAAVAKALPPK